MNRLRCARSIRSSFFTPEEALAAAVPVFLRSRPGVTIVRHVLQRLKPHRSFYCDAVAEATTYKGPRGLTHALNPRTQSQLFLNRYF